MLLSSSSLMERDQERRWTKEEKKAMIKQRMEAEVSQQRGLAQKKREAQALRRRQEKGERETIFRTIEEEIEQLNSRFFWEMTHEERAETKKEIFRLQTEKKSLFETALGRKIFIGKFTFSDLEEKLKLNPPLQKLYAGSRKTFFQDHVLATFGAVEKWEWLGEKGSIFITFEEEDSAQKAMELFGDYEKKKEFVSKINKEMEAKRIPVVVFVRPLFYARWPRNRKVCMERRQTTTTAITTTTTTIN